LLGIATSFPTRKVCTKPGAVQFANTSTRPPGSVACRFAAGIKLLFARERRGDRGLGEQELIEASRPHLDPDRVSYYVEHLDESTPVTVFDIDGRLLLADGYHRVAAAQRLHRTTINGNVRMGTRRDALEFAAELAQQQRGLSREQVMAAITRRATGK
jgi:hypothetical protein